MMKCLSLFTLGGMALLGLSLLCACSAPGSMKKEETPPQAVGGTDLQRGINLGNALEAPSPGAWGVSVQPHYFSAMRQAGFDTLRLPVRFSAHAADQPPYALDEDFMQQVDESLAQAMQPGLNVILDFHHYEELMRAPQAQRERFLAIWSQLAQRYRDQPPALCFELLNEPQGQLDAAAWNDLLAEAIALIRRSNPQRRILVGGVDYNSVNALAQLRLPADEHLIATFHFYEPFEFTHQGADWVAGAQAWLGTAWQGSAQEQQVLREQLDAAARWSQQSGIPLVMGEFGSIRQAQAGSRQRWTAFVAREAEKRGLGWIYWDWCGEFRIYDCGADAWEAGLLEALMAPAD